MANQKWTCLIVEDNLSMRDGIETILRQAGYHVNCAENGEDGLEILKSNQVDFIISDYKLPNMNGLELLKTVQECYPQIETIIITAFGSIELAIEAMKAGAWDFVTKPFSKDTLLLKTERLSSMLSHRQRTDQLQDEKAYLESEIQNRFRPQILIGDSEPMQQVYKLIQKVGPQETTVFISGESGTGKELVAQAIHNQSTRKDKPFIRVNCSALAEGLLESELFGHEKGAFTGAIRTKRGRFELADGGTLFMDEIGDLPLSTQVKLLRVIQEKTFERVGGEETLHADVRLITATHRDLQDLVKKGDFREDLYYRLHIFPIHLPPLRERKTDISLLVNHFLNRFSRERGTAPSEMNKNGLETLLAYNWPGNVRELENILERATVLSENQIITEVTLEFLHKSSNGTDLAMDTLDLEKNVSHLETKLIKEALQTARGIKSKAARLLGIKETTLHYKLDKYNLRHSDEVE